MTIDDRSFSETSPLLTKATNGDPERNDTSNGSVPAPVEANGSTKPTEDEEQHDAEDREGQYEGMPEVKQQLKYIVPAIAIGVSDSVRIRSSKSAQKI